MDAETRKALDLAARAILATHRPEAPRPVVDLPIGCDRIIAVQLDGDGPWRVTTMRGFGWYGSRQPLVIFRVSVAHRARMAMASQAFVRIRTRRPASGADYITQIIQVPS